MKRSSQTYEALLADMGADIAILRSELEARTEEIRRRDHIIAGFIERLPELPAGDHPQQMPQERDPATLRGDQPAQAPGWPASWTGYGVFSGRERRACLSIERIRGKERSRGALTPHLRVARQSCAAAAHRRLRRS